MNGLDFRDTEDRIIPIDQLEHLFEDSEQDPPTFYLPSLMVFSLWKVEDPLQFLDKFVQNVRIHQTQDDQEGRTDGGSDDSTHGAEAVKTR